MDVKPWEPVKFHWQFARSNFKASEDNNDFDEDIWMCLSTEIDAADILENDKMSVALANNQRVIVRALSEDRKAARAARKEASQ